ncbi:hypothetical protein V498_09286 [Pseudogymnoascus sp. VKM F-4517 (FW-2822)]|nr:hypothetical protein V498_09286 [Pseudogymnoascus sp. VKM F-4517 (FW-2822)]
MVGRTECLPGLVAEGSNLAMLSWSLRSGFRGRRCGTRRPRDWATGCRVAERALFVGDRTAHVAQMGKGKVNAESKLKKEDLGRVSEKGGYKSRTAGLRQLGPREPGAKGAQSHLDIATDASANFESDFRGGETIENMRNYMGSEKPTSL